VLYSLYWFLLVSPFGFTDVAKGTNLLPSLPALRYSSPVIILNQVFITLQERTETVMATEFSSDTIRLNSLTTRTLYDARTHVVALPGYLQCDLKDFALRKRLAVGGEGEVFIGCDRFPSIPRSRETVK
jgi:hypothetical protein